MQFRPVKEQLEILMRGVIDVVPQEELEKKLQKSYDTGVPLRIKMGVDPTAPDVHFGHTVVMRKLRQFQDLGHTEWPQQGPPAPHARAGARER